MKKLISVLLCTFLLFSFSVFASATAEKNPKLTVHAYGPWLNSSEKNAGEYFCFGILMENCTDFESLELLITYNPDVLEYVKGFPFLVTAGGRHSIACTVTEAGQLRVNGYKSMSGDFTTFSPFCLKVIGEGNTNITVEIISWQNADGEIKNGEFATTIENTTITDVFVKFDINGDGFISAEDARQALRISVGLETATDRQYYVAGLTSDGSFNAEFARIILRYSVGLPL